jgi:hypothetical protein
MNNSELADRQMRWSAAQLSDLGMNMFTFLRLRKTSNVFIPNFMAKAMKFGKERGLCSGCCLVRIKTWQQWVWRCIDK